MKSGYSVETFVRVYDDADGDYVQVGPDPDGLGCCMIRYSDGGKDDDLIIPWEMAVRVAEAIQDVAPRSTPKNTIDSGSHLS